MSDDLEMVNAHYCLECGIREDMQLICWSCLSQHLVDEDGEWIDRSDDDMTSGFVTDQANED